MNNYSDSCLRQWRRDKRQRLPPLEACKRRVLDASIRHAPFLIRLTGRLAGSITQAVVPSKQRYNVQWCDYMYPGHKRARELTRTQLISPHASGMENRPLLFSRNTRSSVSYCYPWFGDYARHQQTVFVPEYTYIYTASSILYHSIIASVRMLLWMM